MAKKSKKQNDKNRDNVVAFPSATQNAPIDGARLREEYEAEAEGNDADEISDEVAEYVITQLYAKSGKDYNYSALLLGLNKAYLQVLLQLVEDSGFDSDEYLDYFYKEADRIAENYIAENSIDFDPVKASGSLALAASYIFGAIDDEDE